MSRKITVVIDMQNDFLTGALRNEEAIKISGYVIDKVKKAKEKGETVLFTMDTHGDDYMQTEEGQNLPVVHCISGTEGWELIDGLKPYADKNNTFIKETFGSKDFAEYLRENADITEIEFIGVCTDICVISNVMLAKAMLPNAKIYVDAAGCAGVTPEAHDTALNAMKACHIKIVNEGQENWR